MQDAPAKLPNDLANAVNLMAHPAAGAAALSALSFGLASQMLGVWMGAMAGATEASRKIIEKLEEDANGVARAQSEPKRSATISVLAEVRKAAERKAPTKAIERVATVAEKAAPAAETRAEAVMQPDDLKLISGIGPKVEKVLNDLGILTFAQIAAWTAEEAAAFDSRLAFGGRIVRDAWQAQASALQSKRGA